MRGIVILTENNYTCWGWTWVTLVGADVMLTTCITSGLAFSTATTVEESSLSIWFGFVELSGSMLFIAEDSMEVVCCCDSLIIGILRWTASRHMRPPLDLPKSKQMKNDHAKERILSRFKKLNLVKLLWFPAIHFSLLERWIELGWGVGGRRGEETAQPIHINFGMKMSSMKTFLLTSQTR